MNLKQFSLDPRIGAGIKAAGYTTPTPIQQQAIPVVLKGRDVLGLAQTGTGKTAAFVLPILQRLTRGPLRRVRVLIVAPTRELAEQIHQDIVALGKKTKIRSATVYGGVSKRNQVDALRRGAEIVVACPGRLLRRIRQDEPRLPRQGPRRANRLTHDIPMLRLPWTLQVPGSFEVDMVHPCSPTTGGEYMCTLQLIDVATGWSETDGGVGAQLHRNGRCLSVHSDPFALSRAGNPSRHLVASSSTTICCASGVKSSRG